MILALFAVLLPQVTWGQSQGYAELKVNEAGKTFANYEDDDITYTLTFYYGAKPSDTETAKYFDAENTPAIVEFSSQTPGWLGLVPDEQQPNNFIFLSQSARYKYATHITHAVFDSSFAQARPVSCYAWFAFCTKMQDITGMKEYLNTEEVTTMSRMFRSCPILTDIDVSNFNTSKVQSMYEMFNSCMSIEYIPCENFDVRAVRTMPNMFLGCHSLKQLDLHKWDMSGKETNIPSFVDCYSLESLDLSTWNTAIPKFFYCRSLKSIDLSSMEGLYDTDFYRLFQGCASLETIDLSSLTLKNNIKAIARMFDGCTNLKTIYTSSDFDISNLPETYTYGTNQPDGTVLFTTIDAGLNAFKGCTNLVGGNGTVYDPAHVDREYAIPDGKDGKKGYFTATKAFAVYHPANHTLYLINASTSSDFTQTYTSDTDGAIDTDETDAANIVISNLIMQNWNLHSLLLEAEGENFSLTDIQRVVIEPSFSNLRPTTLASWFEGMANLSTIEGTDHIRTNNTTSTAKMFKGTAITSFDANDWEFFTTRNVTDMSGMFADCTSLTTLDLSSSNFSTANVTDMENMFSGCSNLKYTTYTDANDNTPFNIDMFNTLKVTDMSGMFRGCAALAGLLNLNRLATENVTDMSEMFQNCTGLTTLQLGGANTKSVTAADRMFQGCSNLETIKVNLIWDMQKGQSTAGMFDGCNKLTGQNGSKYITYLSSDPSNAATGKYAVIDDDATPGYLTEMVPVVLDLYADGDNEAQIQSYGATGQKINSVRVHRTFTAGQWTTLCLPFDMTAAQVTNIFGISSGDLLTLSRYNRTSHAVTYTAATEIKAGVPYLIKPSRVPTFKDDDNNTQYGFAVPNRTISAQTSNVNSNGLILKANYSSATITPGTSEELYTLTAGQSTLGTDLSSTAAYITPEENHVGGLSAYFMLYTADYVTVTMRNSTLDIFSCNYDLDFTDSHLKAWIASAFTPEGNGGKVVLTRITDVPAGTGVVITTTDANSLTDNVPIGTSNIIVRNLLVGTPDGANFTPQMNGNTIYVVSKSTGSIGNPTRGGTMGAGLGWLAIPTDEVEKLKAANGGQANIRFVFEGEDSEATGIEIVEEDAAKADGIYYNLNGQRVTAPTKGIYIKDGKKVYVK